MDRLRRQHGDPGMFVCTVVPGKECTAKLFGILNAAKAFWEVRTILQGLELGFRIRIVIAYMGAAVSFGDAQVGQ